MSTGKKPEHISLGDIAREESMSRLRQALQGFLDLNTRLGHDALTATFTIDGAAYCSVTPGQRRMLMAMAPARIQQLNDASPRSGDFTPDPPARLLGPASTQEWLDGSDQDDTWPGVRKAFERAAADHDGHEPLPAPGRTFQQDGPDAATAYAALEMIMAGRWDRYLWRLGGAIRQRTATEEYKAHIVAGDTRSSRD